MYVMRVPIVSTAHLKRETYERLEREIVQGEICGAAQFSMGQVDSLFWRPDTDADYESDLHELRVWAEVHGFEWIRLDGNIGEEIDGLPMFKETWE